MKVFESKYYLIITGINHITLAVENIDKLFKFYQEIMEFKPIVKWNKGVYFLSEKHFGSI